MLKCYFIIMDSKASWKTLYACPLPAVARMIESSDGCFPITQSPSGESLYLDNVHKIFLSKDLSLTNKTQSHRRVSQQDPDTHFSNAYEDLGRQILGLMNLERDRMSLCKVSKSFHLFRSYEYIQQSAWQILRYSLHQANLNFIFF